MVWKMELKKIWRLKILLIIAVMGLLFGFLFLEFPLNYFPNGHPMEEQYQLMQDWTEEYGVEMGREEYGDALQKLKNELGVTDEEADGSALISYVPEEDIYLQQVASALYEYELRYQKLEDGLGENLYSPAEQTRIKDIIQNEKRDGILPYEVMGNAMEYWRWCSVFILLSVMVLVAPNITKDFLTGVRKLQYVSKCGRRVLKIQFFATVLSAMGIAALEVFIFALFYARLGVWEFWDNPINSFFFGDIYWFDLSFGQYLLVILLLIALFTGGAAGIAFSLSCFSRNYISLMLKIIPAFFVLGTFNNMCIKYLFGMDNLLCGVTGLKGIQIYVGVAVLLLGAVFSLLTLKYQTGIVREN